MSQPACRYPPCAHPQKCEVYQRCTAPTRIDRSFQKLAWDTRRQFAAAAEELCDIPAGVWLDEDWVFWPKDLRGPA